MFHRCSWCLHYWYIRLGSCLRMNVFLCQDNIERVEKLQHCLKQKWLVDVLFRFFTFSSQEWPKPEISQKRGVLRFRFPACQAEAKSPAKLDEPRQSNFSFNPKAPSFTLNPQARCCLFFVVGFGSCLF